MPPMIIPTSEIDNLPRLQVNVHIQAEVLAAEVARRRANVWLLENIGNLLRAEMPELVLGEQLIWRSDIVLTSPARGVVGRVGRLEMNATTGEMLTDKRLALEMIPLADTYFKH